MAQQELNLLQVSAGFAAELGATPHIMGGKLIDHYGLPCVLGHDVPDHAFAQCGRRLFGIFAATNAPKQWHSGLSFGPDPREH